MNKTEQTTAIISLIDAITAAAETGLTRGDTQVLLLAGRNDEYGIAVIKAVLDPHGIVDSAVLERRAHVIAEVARAADIEVIRKLLV